MHHGPSPAAAIAAALAARAEDVCRRYLPNGRRLGRYWICGNLDGVRGRSLFVRLSGSGKPGGWTDAATGEHGDLLDLIRHRINAPTLRAALVEARRFLALPPASSDRGPGQAGGDPGGSDAPYDTTEAARRLWRRCRAVGGRHAEAYLPARGLARA
ncbi:MAG: DNA primase, partial [Alphaproteobacteria bacterium]|nr:DNA primase [Alphaproteobacteria bacterium]